MITLKFGGTSMGNAARISDSAAIMLSRAEEDRISVVVSAVAGVSNRLLADIDACARGERGDSRLMLIAKIHNDIVCELESAHGGFRAEPVYERLEPVLNECGRLLDAVGAMGECPASVHARIMGTGELLSSVIVEELLRAKGADVLYVDSRRCIFTTGRCEEGDPDYEKSSQALAPYRDGAENSRPRILLFPGFVCNWNGTGTGLLGRNGSDFSASIIAYGLGSSRAEFWSDVDGIFTADPRVAGDALPVDELSYEEAMELAFFGSKVLHPKTLYPLSLRNIEARCLNSFNPDAKGTRIASAERLSRAEGAAAEEDAARAVRGISCLKDTAMISVSGAGMKGRSGTAARMFAAVSHGGVSVLLITQSSSEYTISFCVRQEDAEEAARVIEKEFELEIRGKLINSVEVKKDCAVVSIVGDSMRQVRGVAATFFEALASADINVLAIAQGSSERSISAVIAGENGDTAVRICHRFFFGTSQTIEAFVFGTGTIGGCLLDQIRDRQKGLAAQKIDITVSGIADVDKMLLNPSGVNLASWRDDLSGGRKTSLDDVLDFVAKTKPLNPVFVDCTASPELCASYIRILKAGMHIATPNKRANSMDMGYYRQIRNTANKMRRRFLYETNVGAGLPVIDTLQNLFKSGDRLKSFAGIMSGSLSYIFGRLDDGASFSEAVLEARAKKYTEPDPRDDLSGADVARKALIIAREAGFSLEPDDVEVKKALPPGFDDSGSAEDFLKNLPKADGYFAEYISRLKKAGKALRMGATIESESGARSCVCSVGMMEVDTRHPLYAIRDGENAFVFTTERYSPIPLCVRGYGAGAAVTAAGVFGDILRTVSWNP
jgi:aspartokinase/homoserine dehydrogenase 1